MKEFTVGNRTFIAVSRFVIPVDMIEIITYGMNPRDPGYNKPEGYLFELKANKEQRVQWVFLYKDEDKVAIKEWLESK